MYFLFVPIVLHICLTFLFVWIYTTYMANHTKQFNNAITLSKQEYLRLKQQAQAYRALAAKVFEMPLKDPIAEVVTDFRTTGLYTKEFLADLEDGLRKSSYARKYANQTSPKRH